MRRRPPRSTRTATFFPYTTLFRSWELGVADGYKGLTKIALFPASDSAQEQAWASWEYLGLYRRIVWGDLQGHQKRVWMVLDEKRNTRSEEHTSELQSLMSSSYAVFCLKKKTNNKSHQDCSKE